MTICKSGLTPQLSSITKKVAWFNIFMQLVFPISATLPANVFANGNNQEKQTVKLLKEQKTYLVKVGDTPESIAKQFNIKLFKLIEANPNYVSLVGKLKIKEGITLNIPDDALLTKKWLNNNNQDIPIPSTNGQELAQIIVDNSSLLNKDTHATQYAISRISSKANQQIEQWLNQFGHAQVSLSTDKKFTLEGSSADLLIPLYDSAKNLVFSQTSYHRKDSRSQLNQGIGYRHFADKFMVGLNAFYDYDLSRYHSRFGVGAEVWRDYFKLSANHYHRLSNWRTSDDVIDYNERPANGWDIRAEGYLPAYPQLGTKLIFEQYYGKEVGLFGKDNRQENPHAYTAGLTYTPVPLLTLGAERRFGLNDNSDNKFDVNIQYRLGESLSSQLNPNNVRAMRLMSGNRYDFVDRNNDIVLEYKKKTLVFLSITPTINGYAKEEKDLGVQVHSKYPVKQIEWSASRLIANGGKINHNNNLSYSIILPRHITGSSEKNSYTISAVAIDEQGNRSDPVQSQIIVDQSAINTQNSQFTPTTTQLPADNYSAQNLTLSILDNDNLPVDINFEDLSLQVQSNNPVSGSKISNFSQIDTGKYQVTVTAGSSPEILTLTPKFRDNIFNQAQVTFVADIHSAIISKGGLTVLKNHAPADGITQNKIQVIVTDINANRIPNYPVSFTADNGATIIGQANTDAEGKIIVPITNTHIGKSTVNANVRNITYSTNVDFIADINSAKIKTFTISPNSSFANGTDQKLIDLNIVDKNNNPVPNAKIQLSADNQAQLKETELLTDNQGNASTTMTSKISGTVTVAVLVNKITTKKTTQFIADLSNGKIISVTPSAPPYIADGKTTVTFTAVVEDKNHNILPNAKVIWSTNRDQQVVAINEISTTDNQGIAQTTVTSTQAFDVIVTASISNESLDALPITFIANNQQGLITLTTNKTELIADNKEQAIVTAVVKDKFGNKLPNVTVEWQSSASSTLDKQKSVTDNQGQTTNRIRTKKAGTTNIIATLLNKEKAQVTLNAIANPNSANIVLTTVNNKTEAIADNNDTITLMAHVTDAENNPLIKQSVFWHSTHNVLSENMVKTDDNGYVQVVIKGTEAQPTTITATLGNGQSDTKNLHFIAGLANASQSTFLIEPQSIIANGQSLATGTIILKDKFDNPVPKQEKFITFSGDNSTIKFSDIKEINTGVYQTTIRGRQEGISLIHVEYTNASNNFKLTHPLGFIADKQNVRINAVNVIAPFDVTANGTDSVVIRAEIVDKQGNSNVKGVDVGWLTSLGKLSLPISKTDKNGIAEITLSSTQAGTAQVTAMLDSQQSLDADHPINFNTDVISADKSQLSLTPSTIISEIGHSRITLTLKDKYANLLTGLEKKISVSYGTDLTATTTAFNEISTGVYQAQVSALKAGQTTISAKVNSVTLTQTATLTVLPNNQTAKVDRFVISNSHPHAGDTISYSAYISDKHDNPVNSGVDVTWITDKDSLLAKPLTFTDNKGIANVELTRNPAGIAKVNAVLISGSYSAPDVNFVADDVDENSSEINLIPETIIANGTDTALLTLAIKDKGGNILPDQQVEGISNNPTIHFSPAKQVSPGHYEIEATGTKSGTAQLSVKVNGVDFKKQKTLQLRADATTWRVKSVDVDRTSMIAGDKGVNYQATIVDANDNILPHIIVSWKLQGLADDYNFSTYTDAKGIAKTKVTSKVAGILKMSAYLDLNNHKPIQDVTVNPTNIDANKSTFDSNRQSIGGDDKDSALLTVNLMDKYGNTIDGKKVSIKTTSGKPNFSDNPLNSLGNGKYQTNLTSHIKTDIILTAEAEGLTIAKPLTIKVTIPKPDIIFDKKIQQETYASAPISALGYTGLPNNINVMWSSSDPTIASINTTNGSISMKKAGTVIITLQTSGNDQYQPAQTSYPLVIEKADIGLMAKETQLHSIWDDNIPQQVVLLYNNKDAVNNPPPKQFINYKKTIIAIDDQGKITPIKPGDTAITVLSESTEQFKSSSTVINYTQDKGTINYRFKNSTEIIIVDALSTGIVTAQKPTPEIPTTVHAIWSSSDPDIVEVTPEGKITHLKLGNATLTLSIKDDDYYHNYENSYSVRVKPTPHVNIDSITFQSGGHNAIASNSSDLSWEPIYTTDNQFTVNWSSPETPFAINFALYDKDNKLIQLLERQDYQPKNNISTPALFVLPEEYINKPQNLKLKVSTYDFNNTPYTKEYNIAVKSISVATARSLMAIQFHSKFIHTDDGTSATYCRTGMEIRSINFIAIPEIQFKGEPDKLLYPIKLTAEINNITLNPSSYTQGVINQSIVYPSSFTLQKGSGVMHAFETKTLDDAVDKECWEPDSGDGVFKLIIEVHGNKTEMTDTFKWNGGNGIYKY
ncbi:Ig-like domain-containing protein [Shigella sp. FC1655]|uniref:Ig-like domain-containing protein n=1 Tax=unclassified Shigella TaxID=2629414 RepID=UPI00084824BD|nr:MULTISPECIES: Ig-like domain-containing protein [unclassified Shigella]ODQ06206.1 intimin [Shigella sp. FC130]OEI93718.1 intimin [Shigella sp. FC1655]